MKLLRTIARKLPKHHLKQVGKKLGTAAYTIGRKAATNYLKNRYPQHHESIDTVAKAFE